MEKTIFEVTNENSNFAILDYSMDEKYVDLVFVNVTPTLLCAFENEMRDFDIKYNFDDDFKYKDLCVIRVIGSKYKLLGWLFVNGEISEIEFRNKLAKWKYTAQYKTGTAKTGNKYVKIII